jgi:hypothetical protein
VVVDGTVWTNPDPASVVAEIKSLAAITGRRGSTLAPTQGNGATGFDHHVADV